MPRKRMKYVQIERSRHGRVVYYFRAGSGVRVRLPDTYDSPEFWAAYSNLMATAGHDAPKEPSPSRIILPKANPAKMAISLAIRRSLKGARMRATARGMEFDLTEDWLLSQIDAQDCRCAPTLIPFFMKHEAVSRVNPYAPLIDRINSRGGYTKDNVRVVIFAINMMLLDWGSDVFERVANSYRSAKSKRPALRTARRPDLVGGAHVG